MSDKRVSRQLGILLLLRSREWVSAKTLAERFGVSQRTIYRDIEDLLTHQIPIEGVPGPDGGYRLNSEAPFDPLVLGSEDALRMYLLASARRKSLPGSEVPAVGMSGGLPEEQSTTEEAGRLWVAAERLYIDTSDWYWNDQGSALIPTLSNAVFSCRAVSLKYEHKGTRAAEELVVLPYGLVWKSGEWYLAARRVEGEIERYRVNSIFRAEITDLTFPYPDKFFLQEWWKEQMEDYGKGDVLVRITAKPSAKEELSRLSLKSNSLLEDTDDGGLSITLFVDNWQWLIPLLASYGPTVTVESPLDLRDALVTYFREGLAAYALGAFSPQSFPGADQEGSAGTTMGDRKGAGEFVHDDARLRSTRGRRPPEL